MGDLLDSSDIALLSNPSAYATREKFVVAKDGLFTDILPDLMEDVRILQQEQCLQPAQMSKGATLFHNNDIRGDHICWVTPDLCKEKGLKTLPVFTQRMIKACAPLKGPLGLLPEYSVQLGMYKGRGEGYRRHKDAFPKSIAATSATAGSEPIQRQLTWLFYLNDPASIQGGSLRVYDPFSSTAPSSCPFLDIAPLAGRLVVFNSTLVEHQVLPAFKPRVALTFWVSGTGGQGPAESAAASAVLRQQPPGLPLIAQRLSLRQSNNSSAQAPPAPSSVAVEMGRAEQSESRIFVSIAAYRDSELQHTIRDMYYQSSCPRRVHVGAVWQGVPADEGSCFHVMRSLGVPGWGTDTGTGSSAGIDEGERQWWSSNVRVLHLHSMHADGPCRARHIAASLWRGEEYVLQVDSHMRFRHGWDVYCIDLLNSLQAQGVGKPVLSTYPLGYQLPSIVPADTRATFLVPSHFDASGLLRQKARALTAVASTLHMPVPNVLWAGGFSFSLSSVLQDVPYDPLLPHLFFGEEQSMGLRLFTHGYDVFAPPVAVVYHLWDRGHRPVETVNAETAVSAEDREKKKAASVARVVQLCAADGSSSESNGAGRYGLGTQRTVQAFEKRCGVDFSRRTVRSAGEGEREGEREGEGEGEGEGAGEGAGGTAGGTAGGGIDIEATLAAAGFLFAQTDFVGDAKREESMEALAENLASALSASARAGAGASDAMPPVSINTNATVSTRDGALSSVLAFLGPGQAL